MSDEDKRSFAKALLDLDTKPKQWFTFSEKAYKVQFDKGVLVIGRKRGRRSVDPHKMERAVEFYWWLRYRSRPRRKEETAAERAAKRYGIGKSTLRRFVSENYENFEKKKKL
jgi:hypothetical protein